MHLMWVADLPAAAVAPSDAGYKQPHGDVAAVQRAQHEDDNSNGVGQADNTLSTENRQCSSVDTAAVLMKNCAPYDSSEHSAHGVVEQQASSRNGICMLLCAGDRSEGADGASGANRGNAGLVSSHDTASDNIGRQLLEHSRAGRYA